MLSLSLLYHGLQALHSTHLPSVKDLEHKQTWCNFVHRSTNAGHDIRILKVRECRKAAQAEEI